MNIEAQRGKDKTIFIVEFGRQYYLVNIATETCSSPAVAPDVFTRFGYFEPVSELDVDTISEIQRVFMSGTRPHRGG